MTHSDNSRRNQADHRRSNFPSVFDDIRRLLQIIPMRHEAELRAAVALRMEVDESSDQVLGENGRERLQRVANISRANTFDEAISALQEKGILRVDRRYSNGAGGRIYQRGAVYILTRETWPEGASAPKTEPSPLLNDVVPAQRGERATVAPDERNISPPLSGEDGTALSGGDLYKDNDEVYDEETTRALFAGALSENRKAGTGSSADPPIPPVARIDHATKPSVRIADPTLGPSFGSDINNLNPHAQSFRRRGHSHQAPQEYEVKDAVYLDPRTGEVSLPTEAGVEFRAELLRDFPGIDVEQVLKASKDWIVPRHTDVDRKKAIRRNASQMATGSRQMHQKQKGWGVRSRGFQ